MEEAGIPGMSWCGDCFRLGRVENTLFKVSICPLPHVDNIGVSTVQWNSILRTPSSPAYSKNIPVPRQDCFKHTTTSYTLNNGRMSKLLTLTGARGALFKDIKRIGHSATRSTLLSI